MNETFVFTGIFSAFILGFMILIGYVDNNQLECRTTAIEKGHTAVEIQAICK